MEILDVKMEWYKKYSNDPVPMVLVDKYPDNFVYEQKDSFYYAETEGAASYYHYAGPGEGFGGSVFTITMKDGSTKKLKGPWSSRSSYANSLGFGPCSEAIIFTDRASWERGYTGLAGNLTYPLMVEIAERLDLHLLCVLLSSSPEIRSDALEGGRKKVLNHDYWTKIPPHFEFHFVLSTSPDEITKPN